MFYFITISSLFYFKNVSATSTQSQFHERKYSNPNAVPLMNHNLYQIDSSQQLPRSSGPPRTNAKGIYENSQSSIPVSTFLSKFI